MLQGWQMSDSVRLMLAPAREYQVRLADRRPVSWARALSMPLLLAMMLGLLNATAAAGHVTFGLVVDEIASWSFVPLLQLITGAALIASAPQRRISFARSIELLFAAHAPWSLWLIAASVGQTIYPSPYLVVGSGAVPMVVTAILLTAFGREVLGLSPLASRLRMLAHQAVTLLLILTYIELGTRLSVRILGAVGA